MLFPLLIGVAAGVALERYYLSEEAGNGCKEKEQHQKNERQKVRREKRRFEALRPE